MTFQNSINYDYGFGIPGEIVRDGPLRAHTGYVNTTTQANNVFGRMFTLNNDGKTVGAGGTGTIWGILANPKQHASFGGASGPLSPSFVLPNNVEADFAEFAKIVIALTGTVAATPGLQLQFSQADGTISLPATPGTADAGHTMFAGWIEDYPQPAEGGALVMAKINL